MRLRAVIPLCVGIAIVVFVIGVWAGRHTLGANATYRQATDLIRSKYYREISENQLLNSSIAGEVKSLNDPFSTYFDPQLAVAFKQATNGQYVGVGVTVMQVPQGLRIGSVFPDSPAIKAGLKTNDIIIKVNGKSIAGLSADAATALIRGPIGTKVKLTVLQGKTERTFDLRRSAISTPIVMGKLITSGAKKVAYIAIAQFTTDVHVAAMNKLRALIKQGAKGMILDLRNNPGGLVDEAVAVASMYIRSGTIVSLRGRAVGSQVLKASGKVVAPKQPMAVLVNRGSASAAEIVTAALQDDHRATVVGEHTFGKGVFQIPFSLRNGAILDITVGEYFTPNGRNLGGGGVKEGAGVKPNVVVAPGSNPSVDSQLQTAVKVVDSQIK